MRFILVLGEPLALVQTPPRGHDEAPVGLGLAIRMSAACLTVERAQH